MCGIVAVTSPSLPIREDLLSAMREWLESARQEIPDYVDELPIVSATPQTVEAVLRDLISNEGKRLEIGRRGREFAVKWHSAEAGARRFDHIYRELLGVKQ